AWGSPVDGLAYGNPRLLLLQAAGVLAAAGYSAIVTLIILKVIGVVIPLRRSERNERMGLDVTQHGEEAYSHGEGALLVVQERRAQPRERGDK
ncbi:MAG TPA: hypothetical protein VM100_09835, partial [Longimicrobiales bacterium]|nr:hypothetical protein [Longimicrobiales bacterium]